MRTLLLALLLLPTLSHGAIAVVASASIADDTGTDTFPISINATGADYLVLICYRSSREITTAPTFNGDNMTHVVGPITDTQGATVYALVNPDQTTANATFFTFGSAGVLCTAVALSGVDTGSPVRDSESVSGDTTSPLDLTVDSAAGDYVLGVAGFLAAAGGFSITPDAAHTILHEVDPFPVNMDSSAASVSEDGAAPNVTISFTTAVMDTGSKAAVSIKAAGGGGGTKVNPISGRGGAAAQPVIN